MKEKKHISIMIFMVSLSLFCSYHIYYYFLDKGGNDLVRSYYTNNISLVEDKPIVQKVSTDDEEYLGILKIPKINLVQGFYNINSKNNNVNKSVTILKESTFPNNNGSIIYLTAHSGIGYLAFFKDLDKLELDDLVIVDINSNSYKYIVSDIYEVNRTGKIEVKHNINENNLVLSTCSKDKTKQLVIVCKMINK